MFSNIIHSIKNKLGIDEKEVVSSSILPGQDCITRKTGKPVADNVIEGTRNMTITQLYDYIQEYESLCRSIDVDMSDTDVVLYRKVLLSITTNVRNVLVLSSSDIIKANVFFDKLLLQEYTLDEYIMLFLQPMTRIVKEKRKMKEHKDADKVALLISSLRYLARLYKQDIQCVHEKFNEKFTRELLFFISESLSKIVESHVRQTQDNVVAAITSI